ncbi:MAG: glycoside hydrolase family 127 protein [Tepidisphaeraceae bacterium]
MSYAEIVKLGAILYAYTGNKDDLAVSVTGFRNAARDHLLASGVYSSEEHFSGRGALSSHETCDISDYTWSLGYLLMATGDASYADQIETAIFNAGLGAVSDDFKQLQYFSCPNQLIADEHSSHSVMLVGNPRMSYRPRHDVECCSGNVNRMFPNYAARTWMTSSDGGLAAVLYGPSQVTHDGVTIVEQTNYPYENTIRFTVQTATPKRLSLKLRIPGWCEQASLKINGEPFTGDMKPGMFATVDRDFHDGDQLELTLPMTVRLEHWPDNGVSVKRGPLVYALKVDADVQADPTRGTTLPQFPSLSMKPTSAWNYALNIADAELSKATVDERPAGQRPWTNPPVTIRVPARRVADWTLVTKPVPGQPADKQVMMTLTPPLPSPDGLKARLSEQVELISLVPMGSAKLRLTVFPSTKLP